MDKSWSNAECWAWERICAGKPADFDYRESRADKLLAANDVNRWTPERILRVQFLNEILFSDGLNSKVSRKGIRISGAWFQEKIDLENGHIRHDLWLDHCRFDDSLNLSAIEIEATLSLEGSFLTKPNAELDLSHTRIGHQLNLSWLRTKGNIYISNAYIENSVLMEGVYCKENVSLHYSKIGGRLDLEASSIEGELRMGMLEVGSSAFLEKVSIFGGIDLMHSSIGKNLYLSSGDIRRSLNMNCIKVGSIIFMDEEGKYDLVDLTGARIGSEVTFATSRIAESLLMNGMEAPEVKLNEGAKFRDIHFSDARIEGDVSMSGASVTETFDMVSTVIGGFLSMHKGATFKSIFLYRSRIGGDLDLSTSHVKEDLVLKALEISGNLFLDEGARLVNVDVSETKVSGLTSFAKSKVTGLLNMNSFDCAGSLLFKDESSFDNVELSGAHIGRQLIIAESAFLGTLKLHAIQIAGSLLCTSQSHFYSVDLSSAHVSRDVSFEFSTIENFFNFRDLIINGDLNIKNCKVKGPLQAAFVRIQSNLNLTGNDLGSADLSGARVGGELCLGAKEEPRNDWIFDDTPILKLRNAQVGALQDRRDWDQSQRRWVDSWPTSLELDGFTYLNLGGGDGAQGWISKNRESSLEDVNMNKRDVGWYIEWLQRNTEYSSQPFVQLAEVFRVAGDSTKANRILYENRRQERIEAWRQKRLTKWLGSTLLNLTIGYGIGGRYFRALVWVLGFALIGASLLHFSNQSHVGLASDFSDRLIYSLDILLPIVELRGHENVALKGGIEVYFYFQKLLGWILGSFLIAGLAGLTQKQ